MRAKRQTSTGRKSRFNQAGQLGGIMWACMWA
nr:MAG TPA: hypothetical protein [Caudoviricetes sp.]